MTKALIDLLGELIEKQQTCGAIKLQIGGTSQSGMVLHNCIIIHDCPGCIVELVTSKENLRVSMSHGGLHIAAK